MAAKEETSILEDIKGYKTDKFQDFYHFYNM